MQTSTKRPATTEELSRLEEFLRPAPAGRPDRLRAFLVGFPAALVTLLFLNVLLPAPGFVRLLLAVGAGIGAARLYVKRTAARSEERGRLDPEVEEAVRKDLADGRVSVTRYDVEAVVKVASEPWRFVSATWFAKLADGSVVLLVGPHLEEAEEAGEFPASAFEVASGESSGFVLSVRNVGERLAPEKVRAPLSDAEWEELGEEDDETVPLKWAEVLERAAHKPLREDARDRKRTGLNAAKSFTEGLPEAPTSPPVDPIRPK